ncbi:MAG: PD-(D/E)XK nuclease family protein [Lentisphaeria bacterium]|nr:PD-(D/E)XK nuclease family protein [Lentisphaeria bacterium]
MHGPPDREGTGRRTVDPAAAPAPDGVVRVFLGWDRPVATAAAEWLCAGWQGGPLVLDDVLALVPTAQSARRLRLALASHAAVGGGGALAPRVLTPEGLLRRTCVAAATASPLEVLAAWTGVLREARPEDLGHLFPRLAEGPFAGIEHALGAARRLAEVQGLLGEGGLTMAEAAETLAEAFPDPERWGAERWHELVRLEEACCRRLERLGLRERNRALREGARRAAGLPESVRRVVLIALPDPMPLALECLGHLAGRCPVTVLVQAPAELADRFDAWGRPKTEAWARLEPIPIRETFVHVAADPQDQARQAVACLDGIPFGDAAVGVPDAEVVPHLQLALREAGIAAYDPAGVPLASTALWDQLRLLVELAAEDRFESFAGLMRHPDFLRWLEGKGVRAPVSLLLGALDRLQNRHLPQTFRAVEGWAEAAAAAGEPGGADLAAACRQTRGLLRRLGREDLATDAVLTLLHELYAPRVLREESSGDRLFTAAAELVGEALGELDAPALVDAWPRPLDRLRLLVGHMAGLRLYPDPDDDGLELDGWLELLWNDAPHLVITGCNEGKVPESIVGHVFLPDAARRALGLMNNDQRLARDAYLLRTLPASRLRDGSVHIVLGRIRADGDALRPSRLLFRCDDSELPGRALHLFGELPPRAEALPWQRAWTLRPPALPPPDTVSVTAFRDYLTCPFRFYLRRVVGMERLDDRRSELDALDFGNLCHGALEAWAREPGLRDADDADAIAEFLIGQARRAVLDRYGSPDLSAAVAVQFEAACQRLRAAARVQAEQRRQGWRIVDSEHALGRGRGVDLGGLRVRGVVDRIDRHPDGRLRILDYKTGEKPRPPAEEHLGPPGSDSGAGEDPCRALCLVGGRQRRWKDLQLPLYALLLRDELGATPECGYFVLPKAVTETGVLTWEDLDESLLAASRACAEACAEAIRRGVFWPPAETVPFDDFEAIFFGSAGESVDPAAIPFLRGEVGARAEGVPP